MNIRFFSKTNKLLKKRIKLSKQVSYGHGYSILKSSQTLTENEFLYDISKRYDNYGFMSQSLGEELDSLFKDGDYMIGIHRTGYTPVDNKTLEDIFNKGLINNGHIMSGGMDGTDDIERTVTLFYDFPILVGQLKAAHGYKGSEGCVVVKIPKSYLGKAEGEIKPIFYSDNGIVYLLPEFIYGYVPVNANGQLGEIIHNQQYSDIHTYNNDSLIYDQKGLSKAKKDGIDLNNSRQL